MDKSQQPSSFQQLEKVSSPIPAFSRSQLTLSSLDSSERALTPLYVAAFRYLPARLRSAVPTYPVADEEIP